MTNTDVTSAVAGSSETLLVVEDEILIRLAICSYLRECGFKVIEAANADEALIVLQAPDLTVDFVLSDVEMPGTMDGFGLSQWVRTHKPGMPCLLVGSPSGVVDAAADLCESGPMLAKPYESHILLERIKRTLAERKAGRKDVGEE